MIRDTGGMAFPEHIAVTEVGDTYSGEQGMTLRDYFAAKAMVSAASVMSWRDLGYIPENGLSDMQQNARLCYQMADAMLAERVK